jgi:predicted flavoprotein YhiN
VRVDTAIFGAGSAGTVIAARATQRAERQVLLLPALMIGERFGERLREETL